MASVPPDTPVVLSVPLTTPVVPLMIATKLPPLRLGSTMFFVTGFQPKPRWELSVVTYALLPGASQPFEPNEVSGERV